MRKAFLLLLLSLGGCQKDFDEQYTETENRLKARVEKLDKEMADEAANEPKEQN